jgi:hypothetical protein
MAARAMIEAGPKPTVDYEKVIPDATFTLREGVRIIGYGKIIRKWIES